MVENRFDSLIRNELAKSKASKQQSLDVDNYLRKISIQYRGSDCSALFDKEDSLVLGEFIGTMKARKFPGSSALEMQVPIPPRAIKQREIILGSYRSGRLKRFVNKLMWRTVWTGRGYAVGIIANFSIPNYSSSSIVYICNDGKLRCQRKPSVFGEGQSLAYGVGDIPDLTKLKNKSFITGNFIRSNFKDGNEIPEFKAVKLESLLTKYTLDIIK